MDSSATPCIRCGKIRIFSRKWVEKVDGKGAIVTHEEYVCLDQECQKIVDAKFEEMRNRRLGLDNRNNIKISN
ncbi:hypothetical protein HYZ70_01825 [Candidatus Curtissbacteria bacterium]|nr:hypothetical protein [Candidatus Curtissbacteria bacterium]